MNTTRALSQPAARHNWVTKMAVAALTIGIHSVGAVRAAAPGVYYVGPNGNDQWTGTRPTPNLVRSDGPFATIERALRATRDWRNQAGGTNATSPTIYLGQAIYELSKPLELQPQDSGLTLAASGPGRPQLSGGHRIAGWKKVQQQGKILWAADLPQVRDGTWYFRELWVNGRSAVRARQPNQGYFKVAGLLKPEPDWTKGQSQFRYQPGDLRSWNTITEGEAVVMNRWAESRLPVVSLQEGDHVINFGKRSVFSLEEGDPYYLEGFFEALDQPGEWYLDRKAGVLYYMPRPGEALNKMQCFAPRLPQVLRLQGKPEEGLFVENISLRNLAFTHTEWCFPDGFSKSNNSPAIYPAPEPQVGGFGQAEIGVPGAVWGEGVRHCLVENCEFKNLGDYGLELARGCQSNRIVRCEFSQLGAGGIKIGETRLRDKDTEMSLGNEISDCRIHDGGKMFHSAIGVWIGQSPGNRIVHDEIHNFFYTGISIGWTWGYGPASASNNLVAFNHIHHIGIKSDGDGPILSDMGGIYTLGLQPGTRIENNLWHDMAGLRYGGWGIYFDEGSSGIVAVSNVVYRTTHGGFHQHYGETNTLQNNIFAFARDHQLQRSRVEPHISFIFQTNIVYFDKGVLLGGDWSKDQYVMDWNDYFDVRPDAGAGQMKFGDASLEQWRQRGHDAHSIVADPLFFAPTKDDFRLKSESPALKLGFQPIDLGGVGVRTLGKP